MLPHDPGSGLRRLTGMTDRTLKVQQRDWEELAEFNAEWAVLTTPEAKSQGWDLEEFFATGTEDVARVMQAAGLLGLPQQTRAVLDFGCGVGRLARPLANRFDRYVGLDISSVMIERAEELHHDVSNASFAVNLDDDLSRFEDGEFDAVFAILVLQHLPSEAMILRYLSAMARILASGGLILAPIPSHVSLIHRLGPGRRLFQVGRALRLPPTLLHRIGLQPMKCQPVPEGTVEQTTRSNGCEIVRADAATVRGLQMINYWITKR
jgi:SAM-dependent methyltransferase